MEPIHLFDLASRYGEWATVRQATISGNIANANTPGYRALDIEPFTAVFDETSLAMVRTSANHLGVTATDVSPAKVDKTDSWDVNHSGNSVSLDQELIKAGEVSRGYTLSTNIVRSFHNMLMLSVRSGS